MKLGGIWKLRLFYPTLLIPSQPRTPRRLGHTGLLTEGLAGAACISQGISEEEPMRGSLTHLGALNKNTSGNSVTSGKRVSFGFRVRSDVKFWHQRGLPAPAPPVF